MSALDDLKDRIDSAIYTNTEQNITGDGLQTVLDDMVDTMGVSVSQNSQTGHTDITIGSTTTPVASVEDTNGITIVCDADYYKDYPLVLPVGSYIAKVKNGSTNYTVTLGVRDENSNIIYGSEEITPTGERIIHFVLNTEGRYITSAFVGTTIVISKASSINGRLDALIPLVDAPIELSYNCDVDYYAWKPCALQAGKWKVILSNASESSTVGVGFRDSNNEEIIGFGGEDVAPQSTSRFVIELPRMAAYFATAFVGTTLEITKATEDDLQNERIQTNADKIEVIENVITIPTEKQTIIVDINGTIGTDCDFNDVDSALDSITDNSKDKQYLILVKNGVYDITGVNYLGFKNYVTVKGENRDKVIIKNSSVTYNDSVVCFDPAKYGDDKIDYSCIESLTLSIKNGKCGVHIDGRAIKKDGKIVINNCRFINELDSQYLYYLRGGVNCGLNGGQTVEITNCFGDVLVYAHTRINPQFAYYKNEFIVNNSQFNFIAYYDISDKVLNNEHNRLIVKGCKCDYIGIGVSETAADKTKCSIDYDISNDTQFNWVYVVGQGYITGYDSWFEHFPICGSIHQVVRNVSGNTISKGTFVSISIDGGIPASDNLQPQYDYNIIPYNGELYGFTLEDIPNGGMGIIQTRGKVLIPDDNYSVGDYITLDNNGAPIVGTKANAIGIITSIDNTYLDGALMRLILPTHIY